MNEERIAVVGGGIFGVTAAVQLAKAGNTVTLFEQSGGLLSAASRANQRRLHRGYHYPRGMETATAALRSVKSFEAEFGPAVHRRCAHYIAIARHRSLVSAEQYTAFCDSAGLRYREEYPPFLRRSAVQVSLRVEEALIDIDELRRLCALKLRAAGVAVRLRTRADRTVLRKFGHVVLATYAALNELQPRRVESRHYQFEVCEKPLVRLPAPYREHSLVVMDGPFMCVDPVAGRDTFLLGNVEHAIHATNVGEHPLVPAWLVHQVNQDLVRAPRNTRFPEFVESAGEFMSGFDQAEHVGSYFTVRSVLPDLEATDDRPTLVRRVDERTLTLFGGKITTCVDAAHELAAMVAASPTVPVH